MVNDPTTPKPAPPKGKATLAGLIGATAVAGLMAALTTVEGYKPVGYRDIAGVATNCRGNTHGVKVGVRLTDAQCEAIDEANATDATQAVLRATPRLTGYQLQAATLFTFNLGAGVYASSSAARQFNAGQLRGGCDALQAFTKITVRKPQPGLACVPHPKKRGQWLCGPVKGLVNRRTFEHRICVEGL